MFLKVALFISSLVFSHAAFADSSPVEFSSPELRSLVKEVLPRNIGEVACEVVDTSVPPVVAGYTPQYLCTGTDLGKGVLLSFNDATRLSLVLTFQPDISGISVPNLLEDLKIPAKLFADDLELAACGPMALEISEQSETDWSGFVASTSCQYKVAASHAQNNVFLSFGGLE